MARPMPRDAPVTSATCSANSALIALAVRSDRAPCGSLGDFDDLPAAVLAAVRAGPVAHHGLAALGARHRRRRRQRFVGAALVALRGGRPSLRYRHLLSLLAGRR